MINDAIRSYKCPGYVTLDEFELDLNSAKKLKRLFDRWHKIRHIVSVGALLNTVIVFKNMFSEPFATEHLKKVSGKDNAVLLNTVLVYLGHSLDFVNVDHDFMKVLRDGVGR